MPGVYVWSECERVTVKTWRSGNARLVAQPGMGKGNGLLCYARKLILKLEGSGLELAGLDGLAVEGLWLYLQS